MIIMRIVRGISIRFQRTKCKTWTFEIHICTYEIQIRYVIDRGNRVNICESHSISPQIDGMRDNSNETVPAIPILRSCHKGLAVVD